MSDLEQLGCRPPWRQPDCVVVVLAPHGEERLAVIPPFIDDADDLAVIRSGMSVFDDGLE